MYSFVFNQKDFSMVASTVQTITKDDLESYEIYSTDECVFYVKRFSNGTCQAICYDGKFEYDIMCLDYYELKYVMDNMKGIEK